MWVQQRLELTPRRMYLANAISVRQGYCRIPPGSRSGGHHGPLACTASRLQHADKPHRQRSAVTTSAGKDSVATSPAQTSYVLPSADIERSLVLGVVPEGKGQAIVVMEVLQESQAEQAGIVPGQKLVAVSDPVRDTEVWQLGDRPSLRFVRDTLRMRRSGNIQLVMQDFMNVTQESSYLPGIGATGSMESGTDSDGDEQPKEITIGEKMTKKYEVLAKVSQQTSDVKKRVERRAAYMDEVSQRNDSGFFFLLFAAFLGPALIILVIAYSSGYLDQLYTSSLTIR